MVQGVRETAVFGVPACQIERSSDLVCLGVMSSASVPGGGAVHAPESFLRVSRRGMVMPLRCVKWPSRSMSSSVT